MSANLSVVNGKAEMFSGNGIIPWHGQGEIVAGLLTAAEAIQAAHLGWTVKGFPLTCNGRAVPFPTEIDAADPEAKRQGWQGICREDTGDILGIVKGRYTPIQNAECFDFMDTLTKGGEIRYETAGALRGGRQVWMMARYDGEIDICNDKHQQWLLLVSSHDGSYSLMVQWVTVRVVCSNTLSLALGSAKNQVKIRHTSNWEDKASEAKRVLGLTQDYFADMRLALADLNQQPLTQEDAEAFTRLLIPAKDENEVATRTQNARQHILDLYCKGAGNGGSTRWDALQGVTDYADHKMGLRGDNSTRLESALLGSGAALKQRAFDLLTAEDFTQQLIAAKSFKPSVVPTAVASGASDDFARLLGN